MRNIKKGLGVLALTGFLGALSFTAGSVYAGQEDDTIENGIYIGEINVGGMTAAEAKAAIADYVNTLQSATFTLETASGSIEVSAQDIGVFCQDDSVVEEAMEVCKGGSLIKRYTDKKDLEQGELTFDISLDVDKYVVSAFLEEQSGSLNQSAVDNGLVRENGAFRFIEGKPGVEVNVPASVEAIASYIGEQWEGGDASIELVAEVVEPRGSRDELSKITDLLGGYSTNYRTSSAGRCTNIAVAAGKINGTLLYPGEEFSVYATIGPLEGSNGYELAGSYENGQTVDSYGGGVCQVSTTLYNAVILAELEITQRSNHSMIVTYVQPSMDAAIAGDYKDLRFVNNYDTPIYIEGYTVGKDLFFNIFGAETRPANRKISFVSEVISQDDPPTQYVGTGDPAGTMNTVQGKHTGYVARLWKVVTVDGVEQSREQFNKSTYKASPKIVNVGTASPDPNISAMIGEALASGDEAAIQAAVANAAAVAASAEPVQPQSEPLPQ